MVLPCLNEAASVGLCVEEARAGIAAAGATIVQEGRPGYGSALLAGFDAARGDVVVMADADFTYDFAKLPQVPEPLALGHVFSATLTALRGLPAPSR